jgi:hypothetical protein
MKRSTAALTEFEMFDATVGEMLSVSCEELHGIEKDERTIGGLVSESRK